MDFVDSDETLCPMYGNCRTGRDFTPEFCSRYKCNTFYQIDTIAIYNRIYDYLTNRSNGNENKNSSISFIPVMNGRRIEEDISKIVQEAVRERLEKLGKI